MKDVKFLVVGKSRAGKDEVANGLCRELGLKPVISSCDRPIRVNETQGVEHHFLSTEDVMKELESQQIVAYTKIGKYTYYCTLDELRSKDVYIINPRGIEDMMKRLNEMGVSDLFFIIISVVADEDVKLSRGGDRGSSDNERYAERVISEASEFDSFERSGKYNIQIENNGELRNAINTAVEFVRKFI